MFFIMGISTGEKKIDFVQTILCSRCGQFGRLEVIMTYMYFSFFFIPIFRWNKHYYVKSSCCKTTYEIDLILGKRIAKGEQVVMKEEELKEVKTGFYGYHQPSCRNCGYPLQGDFEYCPKCGSRIS
ncbi:MAG: zinc ribbon protein [Herbinix sp.]|jgi:hypothetical protein|nr:zinc ribbon protein [Herbinix sp.]